MHYFLIAGEASGDLHASRLMASLKEHDPEARFTFLGGDLMAAEAGHAPVIHLRDMAYMGFADVARHLPDVLRNLKTARRSLVEARPDALILIDYPSFNLKVAKTAVKADIPVYYYVSPKVWAWKEGRVKTMKKLVKRLFVIFPFEVPYFRDRHDWDVTFVGNPSVEEIDRALAVVPSRTDYLREHRLRDRPIVALLPGSRVGEIRSNLRVMTAVIERFPQYRGVIAGAPSIDPSVYRAITDVPVVTDGTPALLAHSRAALVTSGTATLETALVGVPQVACYRSNGSKLAYKLMSKILKVKYVTLPNLIADREVIPEQLLHQCTPDLVAEKLTPLLRDTPERTAMTDSYREIRTILTAPGSAPDNTARAILADLNRH